MSIYKYSALKDNKKLINGEINADNLRDAREKIRLLGYIPTKVYTEEILAAESIQSNKKLKKIKFLSLSQKILFTNQMQTLLSAGIPILDALNSVESTAPDNKIKELCNSLQNEIMSGKTFAQALEEITPDAFGNVYIALVKAGEDSGDLEATLDRILLLLRKQESIKGRVIKASIYPVLLVTMMFGILVLFAKFVFPAFASVMAFNGAELPCLARTVMGSMCFLDKFWWLVILLIGGVCGIFSQMLKTPEIKNAFDNFLLKIPVISEFIKYLNLSNFMAVLQVSYDAGVPLVQGLELANKTVGNTVIKSKIFNTISIARTGKTLTESFQRTATLPDEFLSIISAGEKSGTLGKMFKDITEIIDRKLDLALEAVMKLLEPTLIIIMGGAVLLLVVAYAQAYAGMLGSLF